MMLTQNDIETQLTQRRLDNEGQLLSIKQLQTQIANLKLQISNLSTVDNSSTNSGIGGITNIAGPGILVTLATTFNKLVTFITGIVVGVISPSADSTTAIKITKADKVTSVITVDTSTTAGRIVLENNVPIKQKNVAGTINNLLTHASDDNVYLDNVDGAVRLRVSGFNIMLELNSATIGFWGSTPATKQTRNAYTTNSQSVAYGGINNVQAGNVYAQVSDVNLLRIAYENLRASYDDLRTKIGNTTLVA